MPTPSLVLPNGRLIFGGSTITSAGFGQLRAEFEPQQFLKNAERHPVITYAFIVYNPNNNGETSGFSYSFNWASPSVLTITRGWINNLREDLEHATKTDTNQFDHAA